MMRKSLLLLLCLLLSHFMMAGNVTPEEALQKAQQFASGMKMSPKAKVLRAPSAKPKLTLAKADECYYVFNVEKSMGFVIVSGDDRTAAILGYADEGEFNADNIPENMKSWLQGYADQLNYLKQHGDAGVARVQLENHPSIAPLLSSMWNQGTPYNNLCPLDNGVRSVTGCVATAMAQVMYYHKHPVQTTAQIPAYTTDTKGINVSAIPVTTIDWNNMLDSYTGSETTAQNTAVAKLMQLCGSSVKMDYTSNSSGAISSDVANALKNYFDYDAATRHADRGDYRAKAWDELIYGELSSNRPIFYHGQSTGGGHAFVIDGYDKDGYFHVNWGWGGASNSYFLLSILDPESNSGIGASSSTDGYSFYQGAVIDAKPNTGLPFTDEVKMNIGGITTEQTVLTLTDGVFPLEATMLKTYNLTNGTRTFDIGLGVFDADDELVYAENNGTTPELDEGWGYNSIELAANIPSLPDGTYQITTISRENGTSTWYRNQGGNLYFLTAVVSGNTMTLRSPVIDLAGNMTISGNREVGSRLTVSTEFQNNGTLFNDILYLQVNGQDVGARYFEADANETETLSMNFVPTATGTNTVAVGYKTSNYDETNGWQTVFHELASQNVTVTAAKSYTLTLSNGTITNAESNVIPSSTAHIRLTVANTGAYDYNDDLMTYVLVPSEGSYWRINSTLQMPVSVAAGATETVDIDVDNLENNQSYWFIITYKTDGEFISAGDNRRYDELHGYQVNIVEPEPEPEPEPGDDDTLPKPVANHQPIAPNMDNMVLLNVGTGMFLDYPSAENMRVCSYLNDSHGTGVDDNVYFYENGTTNHYTIQCSSSVWADAHYLKCTGTPTGGDTSYDFIVKPVTGGYTIQRAYQYKSDEYVGVTDEAYQGGLAVRSDCKSGNIVWQYVPRDEAIVYAYRCAIYKWLVQLESEGVTIPQLLKDIYRTANLQSLRGTYDLNMNYTFPSWSEAPILLTTNIDGWDYDASQYEISRNYAEGDFVVNAAFIADKAMTFRFKALCDNADRSTFTVKLDGTEVAAKDRFMDQQDNFLIDVTPGAHVVEMRFIRSNYSDRARLRQMGLIENTGTIAVNLAEAGLLGEEVMKHVSNIRNVQHLKVTGKMNSTDFARIMLMANLQTLDLSETDVTAIASRQFDTEEHRNLQWLHEVKLPSQLETIGDRVFRHVPLTEVTLPSTLTSIDEYAFEDTRLQTVEIPASVSRMGDGVFYRSKRLSRTVWSSAVNYIPWDMFGGCSSLSEFEMPQNLTRIEGYAFSYTALRSVSIPEGCEVREHAFYDCDSLRSIVFPTTFDRIDNYELLAYSDNLTDLWLLSPTVVLGDGSRSGFLNGVNTEQLTIHVPSFALNEYGFDEFWYNYDHLLEGFDPSLVETWTLKNALRLVDANRLDAASNLIVAKGGSLRVEGANAQQLNDMRLECTLNDGWNSEGGQVLSNCADMSVNGSLSAKMTLQGSRWYFLSMPFDFTVGEIANSTQTSYTLRTYDTNHRAEMADGDHWKTLAATDVVKAGTGFIVRCYRDTELTFTALNNDRKQQVFGQDEIVADMVVSTTGEDANQGWNIMGNPWPSYFDCSQLGFASPITVWYNYTYQAYSPIDDQYTLRPYQAFFVQSTNLQNKLSFSHDGCQLEPVSLARRQSDVSSVRHLFDLTLTSADGRSDRTRVVLNETAAEGYETTCDAAKMMSLDATAPQVWTVDAAGIQYAISERPRLDGEVALSLKTPSEGTYVFASVRNTCGSVILTDVLTGSHVDLSLQPYEFQAQGGTIAGRFRLSFGLQHDDETTSVAAPVAQPAADQQYYLLDGRRVQAPQNGVNIVRQNGKSHKVVVK